MAQDIALLKALSAKMQYLSQRHAVLAQNVANADTAGYRPQDMLPVDFSKILNKVNNEGRMGPVQMVSTSNKHFGAVDSHEQSKSKAMKDVYEVAPSGNAVVLEEQLMLSGRNAMDYNLVTTLYQKQVGLIKTALGTGR